VVLNESRQEQNPEIKMKRNERKMVNFYEVLYMVKGVYKDRRNLRKD